MVKILAVGGGSGGHVTPVVAVCKELRKRLPDAELFVWCDRKFGPSARTIVQGYDASVPVDFIISGKLRRYHGMSKWHLLHPSILLPNLVDMMKVAVGFVQSFVKLLRLRPDVVFVKGGYVCLPVGYAAHLLRIPLVIHDSDAHPGLTNRLLAPFAQKIGTGAPLEYYNYPKEKAQYVGIPISDEFHPYSTQERHVLKRELGFDETRPLTVITGGGLGAARLNEAVVRARSELLEHTSVFLISGKGQYEALRMQTDVADGWRLEPFISSGMAQVLAAADVAVVRAGATTLLELAALHKPTIIVPNGMLTAGHQLKNAKVYQDSFAAIVMKEEELQQDGALARKVTDLLRAPHMLRELGENFGRFAKPHAAKDMAQMIIDCLPKGRTT
jgi:UDP-N-acetylglucosamine--N-acetylmuramyl-(pentapeptide) pyrophosphoryl-undecaprenol N-acetylglucosamine transferase